MARSRDENAPVLVVLSDISDEELSEEEEDFALDPSDPRAHQKRVPSPTPYTATESANAPVHNQNNHNKHMTDVVDLSASNESEEDEAFDKPQTTLSEANESAAQEEEEEAAAAEEEDDDDDDDEPPAQAKEGHAPRQKKLSQWAMKRFLTSRKDRQINNVELPLEPLNDFILSDFGTRFRGATGDMEKINDEEDENRESVTSPRVGAPLYASPKRISLSPSDDPIEDDDEEPEADDVADDKKPNAPTNKKRRENRYFVTDLAMKCYNCGQIGHMSSVCVNDKVLRPCYFCARRGHNANACPYQPCFNCLEMGHEARNCENGRVALQNCTGCGRTGHTIKSCKVIQSPGRDVSCMVCVKAGHQHCAPFPPPADRKVYCPRCSGNHAVDRCDRSGSRQRSMQCYECEGYGHIAAECPSKRTPWRTNDYCFNCGEQGHYSTDCPARYNNSKRSSNKRRRDAYEDDYDDNSRYDRGRSYNQHTATLNSALPTRPSNYKKSRRTNTTGSGGSRSSHSASPRRPVYRRR